MSYDRMNPNLPELISRLFSYMKKDYTTEAYPLSTAEAELLFITINRYEEDRVLPIATLVKENAALRESLKEATESLKLAVEALESVECGECDCGKKHCTAFVVPMAIELIKQKHADLFRGISEIQKKNSSY